MNNARALILLLLAAALLILPACGGGDSQERENAANNRAADFCEEHQIVESQCVWCDPNLIVILGFCHGHGVPEAYCYLCNPDLIPAFKAVGDWCAGHERPESQCYICNPELDPERKEGTRPEEKSLSDKSTADDRIGNEAATFDSRAQRPPSVVCSTEELIVRLDDPEIASLAGLEYSRVESRRITKTVECNGEIAYAADRFAQVSAQMSGIVAEVHKSLGEIVEAGDALVTIKSAQLGATKAQYLQARESLALRERNHARESDLLEHGASTEKDLLEAAAHLAESRIALSEAEQALFSFGLGRAEIDEVSRAKDTSADYLITAPFSGTVVDRFITVGEVVAAAKPLFAVADLSRIWALIDIFESDQREVRVGQPVVLQVEGLAGRAVAGHINWVSSRLDPRTRTLQARVELDNADGLLRANMFARASIAVRNRQRALVVPEAAVQWEGCCNVVFVKTLDAVFQPRKVHLGIDTGTFYEVLSGVDEGEEVVTQGSFLLKTEILKNSIGTGCCEVNPGA